MSYHMLDVGKLGASDLLQHNAENIDTLKTAVLANQSKPQALLYLQQSSQFKSITAKLNDIRNTAAQVPKQSHLHLPTALQQFGTIHALRFVDIVMPVKSGAEQKFIMLAASDYQIQDYNQDGQISRDEMGSPIGSEIHTTTALVHAANGFTSTDTQIYENHLGEWLTASVPLMNKQGEVQAILLLHYDVASSQSQLHFLFIIFCVFLTNCIVITILLSFYLSKRLLNPLERFISDMEQETRNAAFELKCTNQAYQRFVPKEFIELLGEDKITDVQLGTQIEKEMTVMFCDIRSFTTMSESMTPEENFNFINGYLQRISPILRSHGGFVDKYIGDSIMAIFPGQAVDAVRAALAMLLELENYNNERSSRGEQSISIAIGIHTGKLMLGTVGEKNRMDGTVISDTVNVAARLEGMAKKLDASIIISDNTYRYLQDTKSFNIRHMGRVKVKGKYQSIAIYEILDGLPEKKRMARIRSKDQFEMAIRHYYAGENKQAIDQFKSLLELHGADAVTAIYLRQCVKRHGMEH